MFKRIAIVLAVAAVIPVLFSGIGLRVGRTEESRIGALIDSLFFNPVAAESRDAKRPQKGGGKSPDSAKAAKDLKQVEPLSQHALTDQLHDAIKARAIQTVKALLAKGANVNGDGHGRFPLPLESAARTGSMELVRLLLDSGADLKMKDREGVPALEAAFMTAVRNCHEDVARYFLDLGVNISGVGPKKEITLHSAVDCSPDLVQMLLEKGADVNRKDDKGETTLMRAAHFRKVDVKTLRLLLDYGADVNVKNDKGETAFMVAAGWGHVEMTRFLLDNGADVNAKNNKGETALVGVAGTLGLIQERPSEYNVSLRNQVEAVKLLVEKGADVNVKDREGRTALMRFSVVRCPEAVKLLLEKGAEVNGTLEDGSNALFWAIQGDSNFFPVYGLEDLVRRRQEQQERSEKEDRAKSQWDADNRRLEVARLLISHGIDVNAKLKGDGSTALTWAAALGDVELAKLLLDQGAEVDARLTDGRTPLMCAVTSVLEFEIAKKLSPRSEMKKRKETSPAADTTFDSRRIDVAKLLLDREADVNAKRPDGTTALTWAMILGQTEMVKLLLERGADPNAALTYGSTITQWETLHGHDDMVKLFAERGVKFTLAGVAMSGFRNEVRRLLDHGADANAKDAHGTTALMECARVGDVETAGLLLDRGADVHAKDERGWTALHVAVWKGHLDVAALLLDKGTDPNSADNSGWTPLIQAAYKGQPEVMKLLIARGADIDAKDAFGKTAFMRAVEMGHRDVASVLLAKGADVNAAEADTWTPVMAAASWQDRETVKLLRERGAKMTVAAAVLLGDKKELQRLLTEAAKNRTRIPDGSMALLIATKNRREDMVKHLLDKCPDIDIKDSCCDTALLFAIENKHSGIAVALLKKGANVNAADDWRKTALHYAVWKGDLSLVRLLVGKGADVNVQTIGWDGAPLMGAVGRGDVEMVKVLLQNGASLHAGVESGDLWRAAKESGNKEVIKMLKAHALKHPDQPQPPSAEGD